MKVCGVDPGGSGALALLHGTALVAVTDMPVFTVTRGKGSKRELDVHQLAELLHTWAPEAVWFEQVGGMEGDSPSSAFNFGRIAGAAEALVKASKARFDFVPPHVWKREMGLIGKNKDDSRVLATNLWPSAAGEFRRKMDDGRAESALIAEYGRRQMVKQGVFG